MLKSTHKPRPALGEPPLPPGWVEHKAPTGHPYYYNSATKQSTYTRPVEAAPSVDPQPALSAEGTTGYPTGEGFTPFRGAIGQPLGHRGAAFGGGLHDTAQLSSDRRGYNHFHRGRGRGDFGGGHRYQDRRRRNEPEDRPRSKHELPGHSPWLLVKTILGRRFVYHPEKGESFWKMPDNLKKAVEEFDDTEKLEKNGTQELESSAEPAGDVAKRADGELEGPQRPAALASDSAQLDESDEYEEVEVTEDEGEEDENDAKRLKIDGQNPGGPQEFNEDDIAYQLAAMGQDYGLDPEEYGDGGEGDQFEEGAEGLPLTKEDSSGLFWELLDDYGINPYTTWDKVIEDGKIIDDDRYTVLPNMKSRKEVWGQWSRDRIQKIKEARETAEKIDPRIPYLTFLQKNATPKLYWPEFKRKFKKEAEMRDSKLSEKEREKWYRDYIARLKVPESTRKSDLTALLKSQPLTLLDWSTDLSLLPPAILTDVRYVSLDPSIRDPLLEAYISTLEPAPADATGDRLYDDEEATKRKSERERWERALAAREAAVATEKRRQRGQLEYGRGRLREEEEEIKRAMKVGKEGLRAQLGVGVAAGQHENGNEHG